MNQKQLFEKIQRIQQQLMQGLIEREQTIKLAFLATLSGEHILLIGPPGTGKVWWLVASISCLSKHLIL